VTRTRLQHGRAAADETELVARLRAGDEAAFEGLVARYYATMLAVARTYVPTRALAEDVVQEAWLGVLQSLDRFEGRSSLKTWIISILVHKAKTRAVRERRTVPFASLAGEEDQPAVEPERFRGPGEPSPATGARTPRPGARPPTPSRKTGRPCAS
jgi:RNA polymerase sigma-70 factor (ECF subfamily)